MGRLTNKQNVDPELLVRDADRAGLPVAWKRDPANKTAALLATVAPELAPTFSDVVSWFEDRFTEVYEADLLANYFRVADQTPAS